MRNEEKQVRIALLDLNEGLENQGMRCLREIVHQWASANNVNLTLKEFEVRVQQQLPGTNFDIYISSGGPGSPLQSDKQPWEEKYFNWLQQIEDWNQNDDQPKKFVFFICHSFQLACRYYNIGNVTKRKSTSFGVFPIHLLHQANFEQIFDGLHNPFYAVDSRDYQVIEPDHARINELGGAVLAIEKDRPYVPYERAIMAVRFNDYFIGTQFHPEADARGMTMHLTKDEKKKIVIDNHGEEKWKSMIEQLNDPEKIVLTYSRLIPNFLNQAVQQNSLSLV